MKKYGYFILLAGLLLGTASCGSGKHKVKQRAPQTETATGNHNVVTLNYINRFKAIAKKEMKEYGIPASITLAQGILESNSGESKLAREANNHFGIKCADNWTGKRYLKDDDHKNECFRVYNNPEESYRDHSKFLAKRRRYAFLFRLPLTDYEAWAKGLKQAGYATDKSYPQKLIYLIEKYHLDKYDREVLDEMKIKPRETVKNEDDSKGEKIIYEVKAGETLYTISRKFGIPVREIKDLNNLVDFDIYEGQILVLKIPEDKAQDMEDQEETEPQTTGNDNKETQTGEPVANDSTQTGNQPDPQAVQSIEQISPAGEQTNQPQAEIETAPPVQGIKHTVQPKETLYGIARHYGVSVESIRQTNKLSDNNLKVGQVLIIPQAQTETAPDNNTGKQLPEFHIVQPGETLYRIHVKYGVPIETLRSLNGLKDNTIHVGQKIRLR